MDIGVRSVLNFQIIRDLALIMVMQDTEGNILFFIIIKALFSVFLTFLLIIVLISSATVLQVVGEGALQVVEEDLWEEVLRTEVEIWAAVKVTNTDALFFKYRFSWI